MTLAAPALYWYLQTGPTCVEGSANVAIGALTGHRLHATTIDDYATNHGIYLPGIGSYWSRLPELLAHYGRHATSGTHSLAYLEAALRGGKAAIVAVNGETLWNAEGWTANVPGPDADHALNVDSIADGRVWMTDTGIMGGAHVSVSLGVFRKAWATSGWELVTVS